MKFKNLIKFLNNAFPAYLSAVWDNDGVEVCTDNNLEVGRILLTLDITFRTLEYALSHGYNCIISHHPMIFSPMRKLDLTTTASRKAVFLARHDICAISLHTRLDAVSGGVNDCFLEAIGVSPEKSEPFGNKDIPAAGKIFSYPCSSAEEFAGHIKKSLEGFYRDKLGENIPVAVRYIDGGRPVNNIAVVAGSGMDFFVDAINHGTESGSRIDTFLTGEGSYHKMADAHEYDLAGGGVNIISAGHFETEALVLPYLREKILCGFPEMRVDIHAVPHENII